MYQGYPLRMGQVVPPKFQELPFSFGYPPTFVPHHKIESLLFVMCPSPSSHCGTNLGKKVSLIAFRDILPKILTMARFFRSTIMM